MYVQKSDEVGTLESKFLSCVSGVLRKATCVVFGLRSIAL